MSLMLWLLIPLGLFLGWLIVQAHVASEQMLAARHLGHVFVSLARSAKLGDLLPVLVRVTPTADRVLTSITISLSGEDSHSTPPVQLPQQSVQLAEGEPLRTGRPEEWQTDLDVGYTLPVSSPLDSEQGVSYRVEVRIRSAGAPDWIGIYPIRVEPPENAQVRAPYLSVSEPTAQPRCPYCHDDLAGVHPDSLVACHGCTTVFHRDCMHELGRCSTPGCEASEAKSRRRVRG